MFLSPPSPSPTSNFIRLCKNVDGSRHVKIKTGESKGEKGVFELKLFVNIQRAEIKLVTES